VDPVGLHFLRVEAKQASTQKVTDDLSEELKLLECEVENSPPPSTEIMNAWSYTSTLSYLFIAS
jgi:hypothetical protein